VGGTSGDASIREVVDVAVGVETSGEVVEVVGEEVGTVEGVVPLPEPSAGVVVVDSETGEVVSGPASEVVVTSCADAGAAQAEADEHPAKTHSQNTHDQERTGHAGTGWKSASGWTSTMS
jgi:hypothetical protein